MLSLNAKENLRLVVAGNATLDAVVQGTITKYDNTIRIASNDVMVELEVADGPIKDGYKHRVDEDIEPKIRALMHQLKPGGGGINTAMAIKLISDIQQPEISYVDVSSPDPIIESGLRYWNINYMFFGLRPVPVNAVLGSREDKIILKGRHLSRVNVDETFRFTIDNLIYRSSGVIINSVKDTSFAETLINSAQQKSIPLYFAITSSLPNDFVFKKMLPNGKSMLNYEDIATLAGENPLELNTEQTLEVALDTMVRIKTDNLNSGNFFCVTLGKHGVYYSNGHKKIFHAKLKDEYGARVGQSITSKTGGTNGAGDTFAGALAYYHLTAGKHVSVKEMVARSCAASIKHIGYSGPLPFDAFDIVQAYPTAARKAA